MEVSNLIPHIEALIFASDKPLTAAEITELVNQAFGFMEDKIVPEHIDAALEGIVEKYSSEFYPFEVRQSGGGWQFLTKKDYHKTVAQLNGEKFLKRLSAAALETLAIIAYKQPITKGEIEAIRGVSSDYSVQKLLEKELIIISGRNEKLPGHPLVYCTSKNFMDYFGINSADDLPKIREVLADQVVEPTIVNHTLFEQSEILAVSDEGELISAIANPEDKPLNGHSFGLTEAGEKAGEAGDEDEAPSPETPAEDPQTEEATEEFIADNIFIEGDQQEELTELPGEAPSGEEPSGNDASEPGSDAGEESSQDDDSGAEEGRK
jgi:segregation and condensation protein B